MERITKVSAVLSTIMSVLLLALSPEPLSADPGTREDRAALFDYLVAKTLERESFSPVKNRILDLDVVEEMRRYRDEMLSADTDEKLFYALVKISNARKDRHLEVSLVEGGIQVEQPPVLHAPLRFAVDYGRPESYGFFVGDICERVDEVAGEGVVNIGDELISINGQPIADYVETVQPYHRYSTVENLWWQIAEWIPRKGSHYPPHLYRDKITFLLKPGQGAPYSLTLPYMSAEEFVWRGPGQPVYENFSLIFTTQTFDFYDSALGQPVILLAWHGFREKLIEDVDRLIDYAAENQMLDHHIIWDGTRSRGGSKGPYAIQRFTAEPFKTTFGNLRVSDVIPRFVEIKRREFEEKRLNDSGVGETVDGGAWLMDWLLNDVVLGMKAGQAYTNTVPFKLAHLPKYSDGILKPADTHFQGRLVCLLGPAGGSHLDQFASIVIDNQLGHTMGMPAGGYSNTWEWEETLLFPITRKPVVRYMWSIGHTIRPNGEILEGNPAKVDEYIPITRDNFSSYYSILISRAMERLGLR